MRGLFHRIYQGRASACILICVGLALLPARAAADSSGSSAFSSGVAAFRAQDFERARAFFLTAERDGVSGARLVYNLGVVHYRLADYAVAERYFLDALNYPKTRQIALYNLGRVAQSVGQLRKAQGYYRQAQAGADLRIAELGRKAENSLKPSFWAAWMLDAQLGLGFDSAVVGLTDQVSAQPLRTADLFQEARFNAVHDQLPSPQGELSARVSGYQLAYETEQQVDLQSLVASLSWRSERSARSTARWGWRLQLGQEWLDSTSYQIRPGLRMRFERGWQGYWMTLDAELEWFASQQARLEGIDGARYQASAIIIRRLWSGVAWLRLGSQFNARRDDRNSPRRVSLTALWRSPQWHGLQWQPSLQWRDSKYSDDALAKERRLRAQLRISSPISDSWKTVVDLEYENNESAELARDYHHTRATLSLRWASN